MSANSTGDVRPDILSRLGEGDPGAAEECLDRYGGLVWSLARRFSPSPTDAEDAVQEIFLAVWKNAARFDPTKSSEPTFINMIARRRLIDLHRHKQRRPEATSNELEPDTMVDGRSGEIESRAEIQLASKAINDLRSVERDAILLSTYHGLSHSEISKNMDLPLGTVKTYIRRGLNRVRQQLDGAVD